MATAAGLRMNGLIPARAGNTRFLITVSHAPRAHPRSRGEHIVPRQNGKGSVGSSPLARGTQGHKERLKGEQGLIPARAGNTTSHQEYFHGRGAHPRSRGEHLSKDWHRAIAAGSSPLARGTPMLEYYEIQEYGLIPARAGNTDGAEFSGAHFRAHPRSRGEHGA